MDFSICLYGFTSEKRSYAYFHEFRILELAFEEQPPRAKKGQRTALFQRLRSFSILRIFSLSFFFSYFFPIILYRVFFSTTLDKLWYDHFFFFYFPTRFIFFFILIPAEVTIEAHMFSGPFVLRCFTTETSYKLRETSKEIFLASFWFFFEKNITNFARRIVVSDSERSKILQVKIQIVHSENVSVRSKEGRGCRAN